MNRLNGGLKYIICILAAMFFATSCRTKSRLQSITGETSIREEVLVSHILKNQLNFQSIYFKRISIEVDDNGKTFSARANMYIENNSRIVIQIFVAILEVARISITPDGITVIDRFNRDVYSAGFDYIDRKLGLPTNFAMLQSILTNMLFSYPEGNSNTVAKHYQAKNSDGIYLLFKKNSEPCLHEIDITAGRFKITRNNIANRQGTAIDIRYSSFSSLNSLNETEFPSALSINGKRRNETFSLLLKYSSIELNSPAGIPFKVPDNYTQKVLK